MMAIANRFLPGAGVSHREKDNLSSSPTRGMQLATWASPSILTGLMNRAARMYNQYAGRMRPAADHARQAGVNPDKVD